MEVQTGKMCEQADEDVGEDDSTNRQKRVYDTDTARQRIGGFGSARKSQTETGSPKAEIAVETNIKHTLSSLCHRII